MGFEPTTASAPLQVADSTLRGCQRCQESRKPLHAIARWPRSTLGQTLPRRLRRVVGIGSSGAITRATNFLCGKSLGFRVAMNAASPSSAHAQNGSSSGSGEIASPERTSRNSASSLSRLMMTPIRGRRTPSRLRTSLYSAKISSLTNHVNVPFSSHSRRKFALGFRAGRFALNPVIPATSTDVSITPLGRSLGAANRYLRQSFLFGAIRTDRLRDLRFCHTR